MKNLTANMVVHLFVSVLTLVLFGVLTWLMLSKSDTGGWRFLEVSLLAVAVSAIFIAEKYFPIKTKTLSDIDAKYSLNEGENKEAPAKNLDEIQVKHNKSMEVLGNVKKGIANLKEENKELKEKLKEIEMVSFFSERLNQISIGLRKEADRHHEKASFLLEQGNKFAKNGVYLYAISIIAWQIYISLVGFSVYHLYGIVTTSLLFVFVEAMAAFYMRQHSHFIQVSTLQSKVKAGIDRHHLSYVLANELEGDHQVEAKKKLIEALEKEIDWPLLASSSDHPTDLNVSAKAIADVVKAVKE